MPQNNDDEPPTKEKWRRSTTLPLSTMPPRVPSRRISPINIEVNTPEARAHELLFGKGARMDVGTAEDWQQEIGALGRKATDDEVAMAMRPRAWNVGRDIRLRPARSNRRDIHLPLEPPNAVRDAIIQGLRASSGAQVTPEELAAQQQLKRR